MLRKEIGYRKKEEGCQPKNVNKEKVVLGKGQGLAAKRSWAIFMRPRLRSAE